MAREVVYHRRAAEDLDHIYDFISQDSPMAAIGVVRRVRQSCNRLSAFPPLGRRRPEFSAEVRTLTLVRT
ncbi:type II toxin-antitoxin system RelE/ParE family toxin [Jiella sp. M17.18]|uniref:type II toxin-antitoxin system RelE/ParE family toxin n=1 Tax=Jiella sp. M17.18 TaxID=3234247 RepID=UPI0034DFA692